jgi:hypothetical protein
MAFPELTERLRRLLRIKYPKKPALSIPQNRLLTADERALAEWLLLNGEPEARDFLPQLATVRVRAKCGCGCPTIDLSVPRATASAHFEKRILADFVGTVDSNLVGVLLHQQGGRLCELEVYSLSGVDAPFGLPDISTLHPFAN